MFKKILLDLMAEKNLSQRELSRKTDIAPTTISGWVNANRLPDYHALRTLSNFFQVPANYLLEIEDEWGNNKVFEQAHSKPIFNSNKEQEIIELIRSCNETQQGKIYAYIQGLKDEHKPIGNVIVKRAKPDNMDKSG